MTLNRDPGKAPSTLADVLRQVKQAFSACADATPIQVGSQYKDNFGAGVAPKILFVPEEGEGSISGSTVDMGHPCSQIHSCDVYVRAAETQDDIERFSALYALNDRVLSCLKTAATGRIEFGRAKDDSPIKAVSAMGAGLAYGFTYQRDVIHWDKRLALDPASEVKTPDDNPSTIADNVKLTATVTPQRG